MVSPAGLFKTTFYTYRSIKTVDSGGSPLEPDFSEELELQGNVQPYKSEEAVKAGREWSNSMQKIYCREDADIDMKDRVFYNEDFYDIVELEIFINTYMMLICSRAVK